MSVREITEAVDLCLANGKLNREAVGFTRTPLHRSNLRGWGRNKRWDYWGIVSPRFVLGMTVASLDYAHASQLYLYDRESGGVIVADSTTIGPGDVLIPDVLPPLVVMEDNHKAKLRFLDETGRTVLKASAKHIDVHLSVAPGGDSLGVVVPWSNRRYQYTLKELARPVSGTITVDGTAIELNPDDSFAVLDRGRGKWPYRMTWNWAAGSGIVDGKRLGLQMGGGWTDGTGVTENGVFVDGHLSYWPDELEWTYSLKKQSPWRVRGERVDATLTPFHRRQCGDHRLVHLSGLRRMVRLCRRRCRGEPFAGRPHRLGRTSQEPLVAIGFRPAGSVCRPTPCGRHRSRTATGRPPLWRPRHGAQLR